MLDSLRLETNKGRAIEVGNPMGGSPFTLAEGQIQGFTVGKGSEHHGGHLHNIKPHYVDSDSPLIRPHLPSAASSSAQDDQGAAAAAMLDSN